MSGNNMAGFFDDLLHYDYGDALRAGVSIYTAASGGGAPRGPTNPQSSGDGAGQPESQLQIHPLLIVGAGLVLFLMMNKKKRR